MPSNMKVSIVDDQPDIVNVLKFKLEKNNFEMSTSPGGLQALEKLRGDSLDTLLCTICFSPEYRQSKER